MSANFEVLIGPSMSGKTYQLSKQVLTEAYENPDKNYIVVVPEQSGNAYEKSLIKLNKALFQRPGFFNIDVVGFNRLAFRVFEEVGIRSSQVFEEYEKNMLIRVASGKVAKSLAVYANSIEKVGFISEMKTVISELISYGITGEDLDMLIKEYLGEGSGGSGTEYNPSLAKKLGDIRCIYTEYLNHLGDDQMNRFMNISEGRLKLLANVLKSDRQISVTDGSYFIFDEYRGYTPDQLSVIEALVPRANTLRFSLCMDKDTIKKGFDVKEHDLFRKSVDTLKDIQKAVGYKPKITYSEEVSSDGVLTHLRSNAFRYPIKEYDGETEDSLRVFSVVSREDEMRVVAELIRDEIKSGYRYEDIVIVTGDTEGFDRHAGGIFREYDIPLFCDYNRHLRKNPYTEAIIRMLDIVDNEYDYDSVFGFMKTGVWKIENKKALCSLENHILKTGIRGHKLWNKEIKPYRIGSKNNEITEEQKKLYAEMNEIREEFNTLIEPLYSVSKGKNKVSDYLSAIRKIIDELDYKNAIEEARVYLEERELYSDSLVMKGLYSVIDSSLTKTYELLGNEEMTIHDFSEILSSGISDISIGIIPPTIDCVHVCDVNRSRITNAKVVHFISMNDGIIPTPSRVGRIISDRERRSITKKLTELGTGKKLADSDMDKRIDDLFVIYQVLSKPTDKLTMSYFGVDEEGGQVEPSYIVGRLRRLYPKLSTEQLEPECFKGTNVSDRARYIGWVREAIDKLHKEETDQRYIDDVKNIARYENFMEEEDGFDANVIAGLCFDNSAKNIPEEIISNINLQLSVSKIESYSNCPYSFFLRYVLGLKERPDRKVELYDIGSIIHEALEKTLKEIKGQYENKWNEVTEDSLKEIMLGHLDASWKAYEEATRLGDEESGKLDKIYQNLKELSERTIVTLKEHIAAGRLLPERMEQRFLATINMKRSDGREMPVVISGIIDRIDSYEDETGCYIRVIDYKTGNKEFKLQELEEGTAVQLSLYTKIINEILSKKLADKKSEEGKQEEKSLVPAGMYYYHVNNPVISFGSSTGSYSWEEVKLEESVVKEIKRKLRLRGFTNIDPEALVGLHDKSAIREEDGKIIHDSDVVPVSVKKDGTFSDTCNVTDTEGFEDICDYSMLVLEEKADRIFSGDFSKTPKVYVGKKKPCEYCNFKSVCRFNDAAGKEEKIYRDKNSVTNHIAAMKGALDTRELPVIKKADFYSSEED